MKKNKANKNTTGNIAQNKKARHDYFLEDKFEAGLERFNMVLAIFFKEVF